MPTFKNKRKEKNWSKRNEEQRQKLPEAPGRVGSVKPEASGRVRSVKPEVPGRVGSVKPLLRSLQPLTHPVFWGCTLQLSSGPCFMATASPSFLVIKRVLCEVAHNLVPGLGRLGLRRAVSSGLA